MLLQRAAHGIGLKRATAHSRIKGGAAMSFTELILVDLALWLPSLVGLGVILRQRGVR